MKMTETEELLTLSVIQFILKLTWTTEDWPWQGMPFEKAWPQMLGHFGMKGVAPKGLGSAMVKYACHGLHDMIKRAESVEAMKREARNEEGLMERLCAGEAPPDSRPRNGTG